PRARARPPSSTTTRCCGRRRRCSASPRYSGTHATRTACGPPSTSSRLVAARRVHPRPGAPYLRGSGSLPRSVELGSAPRDDGHCPTDAGGRIPPLPEPMSSDIPHAEPRAEIDRLRAEAAVLREAVRNLSATVAEQRELVWNINSIVLRWDPQGCIIYLNEY